jgi:hypothetical protein
MTTLRLRLKKQGKRLVHGYETKQRKTKLVRRKNPRTKTAKRLSRSSR